MLSTSQIKDLIFQNISLKSECSKRKKKQRLDQFNTLNLKLERPRKLIGANRTFV